MVDLSDNLKLLITLVIVIPIGVSFVAGGVFTPGLDGSAAVETVAGESVTVDTTVDAEPNGLSVTLTTGSGVYFDADNAERYVETAHGDGWRDGSWGLAFVADLDENVSQAAAYSAVAEGNGDLHVMRTDGDWLAYYDNGTASASVRVDARNQTTEGGLLGFGGETTVAEPVVVRWDDGASVLSIETPDHAANATADADPEPRPVTYDWVGTLDAVRYIEQYPTDADVASYLSEPVAVLPDSEANQTARYMLDEEGGDTTKPYYTDSSATVVGGDLSADGVSGPGLSEGTDYELRFGPFEFTALAGGAADGAPVVHLSWGSTIGGAVGAVAGVLPVLLFLIPVVVLANRITEAM